jgi:energy-coupling factor transport system ATP-binding protein
LTKMEIKLDAVTFSYPERPVFADLSLHLDCSQAIGLSGPNGSGKTTFGKLVMGLLQPASGCIYLDQVPVKSIPLWNMGSRIGYLFQNFSCQLFAATVLEELVFPYELMNQKQPDLADKCRRILHELNFKPPINTSTHRLSMGEKQRLAMATLLIRSPSFLILDEPTASLDERNTCLLLDILKRSRANGVGMLVISHDQRFLDALCDQRWSIRAGRLELDESGPAMYGGIGS